MEIKEIFKKIDIRSLLLGALLSTIICILLSPIMSPWVARTYIDWGIKKTPDLYVEVKEHTELEIECSNTGYFFDVKWEDSYKVYGTLISNQSNILLEDITLNVYFPGYEIVHYMEGGATELNFTFRPLHLKGASGEGYVYPEEFPGRIVYIERLPPGKSLFFSVLIDTKFDALIDIIITEIIANEQGTYWGSYDFVLLDERTRKEITGIIGTN